MSVVLGTPGENNYAGVGILYNVNGSAAIRDESVSFDTVVESYTYQSECSAGGIYIEGQSLFTLGRQN